MGRTVLWTWALVLAITWVPQVEVKRGKIATSVIPVGVWTDLYFGLNDNTFGSSYYVGF